MPGKQKLITEQAKRITVVRRSVSFSYFFSFFFPHTNVTRILEVHDLDITEDNRKRENSRARANQTYRRGTNENRDETKGNYCAKSFEFSARCFDFNDFETWC